MLYLYVLQMYVFVLFQNKQFRWRKPQFGAYPASDGEVCQRNGVVCSDVSINNTITGDQVPAEFEFNLDITFPKILLATTGLNKILCLGIFVVVVTLNTGYRAGGVNPSERWKRGIRQELFCRVIWIMWN